MSHIVKCRICHLPIDTEKEDTWMMPSPRWYYHKECYSDFVKKKGALKEDALEIEADDDLWRSAVYDYLKKDLKLPLNYRKFLSQWEHFLNNDKKKMTAKGIFFSLRYFYEVVRKDSVKENNENGIGIVPYIYAEGTSYWAERNQRDKGICDQIESQIIQSQLQKVKVVLQKKKKKEDKTIDLSTIAEMEDEE